MRLGLRITRFLFMGELASENHLMHAIGNRILENNPDAKIIYITTEAFTNEFIESIQKHTTEAFRNNSARWMCS